MTNTPDLRALVERLERYERMAVALREVGMVNGGLYLREAIADITALQHRVAEMEVALEPFHAAYTAYTDTCRNWIGSGETLAEQRFSEGERIDSAQESAHEALAAITFEQLCAVDTALHKSRSTLKDRGEGR